MFPVYKNQSIDLLCKLINCKLVVKGLKLQLKSIPSFQIAEEYLNWRFFGNVGVTYITSNNTNKNLFTYITQKNFN